LNCEASYGYRGADGYSAHSEAVDKKEIEYWKSGFPYIRVEVGTDYFNILNLYSLSTYVDETVLKTYKIIYIIMLALTITLKLTNPNPKPNPN
jgi:hypothetical protein